MNDIARLVANLTERAKQLGREGNTEPEVIGVNTAIIQLDPTRHDAYIRRGIYYQKQNLVDEAERDFRRVLELSPGNPIASKRLEEVLKLKTEIEALKNKRRTDNLDASSQDSPLTSDYYDFSVGWREETPLHRLGYKITGRSRHQRWQILVNRAVPQLGLLEVSYTIANNCRLRKLQHNGEERYSHAIGEWEHDLRQLRKFFYDGSFSWPSTEIE